MASTGYGDEFVCFFKIGDESFGVTVRDGPIGTAMENGYRCRDTLQVIKGRDLDTGHHFRGIDGQVGAHDGADAIIGCLEDHPSAGSVRGELSGNTGPQ